MELYSTQYEMYVWWVKFDLKGHLCDDLYVSALQQSDMHILSSRIYLHIWFL